MMKDIRLNRRALVLVSLAVALVAIACSYALRAHLGVAAGAESVAGVTVEPSVAARFEKEPIDLSKAVAVGKAGGADLVVAPAVGALARPDMLCLAVAEPSGVGAMTCTTLSEIAKSGAFIFGEIEGTAMKTVWAYMPDGVASFQDPVSGSRKAADGGVFLRVEASLSAPQLELTTRAGRTLTLDIGT